MPVFAVTASITISLHARVTATSKAEARRLAADLSVPPLCSLCAGVQDDGLWSTSGELDGEPEINEVARVR